MGFVMPSARTSGARSVSVPQVRGIGGNNQAAVGQTMSAIRDFSAQIKANRLEKKQDEATTKAEEQALSDRQALSTFLFKKTKTEKQNTLNDKFEKVRQAVQQQPTPGMSAGTEPTPGMISKEVFDAGSLQNPYQDLPMAELQGVLKTGQQSDLVNMKGKLGTEETMRREGVQSGVRQEKFGRDVVLKQMGLDAAAKRGPLVKNVMNLGESEYGPIPKEHRLIKEAGGGARLELIGGGNVTRDIKTEEQKKADRLDQRKKYADIVTEEIDRALKINEEATLPTTGLAGQGLALLSGYTDASRIKKLIGTIKSNVGFDRLQEMRNSSPTGGALGQVSDFENKLLQSTLGDLEQSGNEEDFIYNLKRLKSVYLKIVHEGIVPPEESEVTPLVEPGSGPASSPLQSMLSKKTAAEYVKELVARGMDEMEAINKALDEGLQ